MHEEHDNQSKIICENVAAPLSGREIVTDTVANVTKTFNLATKNSRFSRHFGDYVPLIKKRLKVIKVSEKFFI